MKARLFPWLCAGLLGAVLPLAAKEPPTPTSEIEARIEKLLRELDAPRYAVRDRAMRELRELGKTAVAPLKKALAARRSAEFERRAQILLEPFAPVKTRPLSLEDRCYTMRTMQLWVYNRSRALAQAIAANPGKRPSRANKQESLALADEEKKIIREADRTIRMLEARGAALAFHAAFTQLRDDMKDVQKRLTVTNVDRITQAIEQDVIETLNEMIKGLEPRRWR